MRGRKPEPNELKTLKGVRSSRINHAAPNIPEDSNPNPPAHLGRYAKQKWAELYPELSKAKVLKSTDRDVLEIYCEAYADYREAQEALREKEKIITTHNKAIQIAPWQSLKLRSMALMHKLEVELGITPSSRGRMVAEPPKKPGAGLREFMQKGLNNGQKGS